MDKWFKYSSQVTVVEGKSCTTKGTLGFCGSLVELLSRSQSHLRGSIPGLLASLLSRRCPQHSAGRDGSLHPQMLRPLEQLRWAQLLTACGNTSPWASPVKEADSGFVFAKTRKASSFCQYLCHWHFGGL